MAQERSTGRTGNNSPGTIRKADLGKPSTPARRTTSSNQRPGNKKKPGKSIVNQKTTPWGLIITTIVIVAFAGAIIGVVVASSGHKKKATEAGSSTGSCTKMIGSNSTSYLNELQCAKDIKGVTFKPEANRNHVLGAIKYDSSPPVGGNHNPYWADCTGTVYPNAIANENAVHMLEHGAVWITYNKKTLPTSQLAILKKIVNGTPRMALSPYPNLKTPISLQAWGYQLFVRNASDPRIQRFINVLRYNPETTPEYGATCSQPTFKINPSTFGHPLNG